MTITSTSQLTLGARVQVTLTNPTRVAGKLIVTVTEVTGTMVLRNKYKKDLALVLDGALGKQHGTGYLRNFKGQVRASYGGTPGIGNTFAVIHTVL